jgi:hypothetical protein
VRVVILPLLLACAVPVHPVDPACPHSVDAWYGTLLPQLQRAGGGGAFAYGADEPWVSGYDGHWRGPSGTFVLDTDYAQGYFLEGARAVGVARLEPDGDYLLRWDQRILDRLGVERRAGGVERRQGCAVERVLRSEEGTVTTTAEILDADTVRGGVEATGSAFHVTATWRSDHSVEEAYEGHDGESWYEVLEPGDGTRQATFHLRQADSTEDGGYVRDLAGDREYDFDRVPNEGEWTVLHIHWLLRYDGSGEGEVVGERGDGSTLTCWYSWDSEGGGSYTCDDGTSGPY